MGECAIIEFDYMWKDIVCTHVRMQGFSVEVSNKTDGLEYTWFYNAFGNAREEDVTYEEVESFLEERCFPRTRANCQELLNSVGLDSYDALDIVRITHGIMTDDCFWIRFEGETLRWEDVCQDWRKVSK